MWMEALERKIDKRTIEITCDSHTFDRLEYWNLDLFKIKETFRTGKLNWLKCEKPNKLCFQRYFGKENLTYIIIVRVYENFVEVKIVWPKKGR